MTDRSHGAALRAPGSAQGARDAADGALRAPGATDTGWGQSALAARADAVRLGPDGSLRERWFRRSAAAGWTFPSDWYTPAVDAVCEALAGWTSRGARSATAVPGFESGHRLGRERARAGVGLAETLRDVDSLLGLLPVHDGDARGNAMTRAVSLGWADQAVRAPEGVIDALTGLTTTAYLLVRLAELYRAADVEGSSAAETHALVVVRVMPRGDAPWDVPLLAAARIMRSVFSGGCTLSRLGHPVGVALVARHATLGAQVRLLAELLMAELSRPDPIGAAPTIWAPQVWIEKLPRNEGAVAALLQDLAR